MFQKLFRKNTESVGDANSQKDYLEYCKSIEYVVLSGTAGYGEVSDSDGQELLN